MAVEELNVTDINNQIETDSLADQTADIIAAIGRMNSTVGTKSYGKTAYFPAGTYYISAQIWNRFLGADPAQLSHFTFRGDGAGATILKIYNFADLVTHSALDDFNGSGWTATTSPTPPALNINAQTSGTYTSAGVAVKCGRLVKLRYTRTLAAGMTLNVLRNSTVIATDASEITAYAERTVDFTGLTNDGTHDLKFQLVDNGVGTGNRASVKDIHLSNAMIGSTPALQTIFELEGKNTDDLAIQTIKVIVYRLTLAEEVGLGIAA